MKKRRFALCAPLVLAIFLAACAPAAPAETTPSTTTLSSTAPATTPEEEPVDVYQTPRSYDFWLAETEKLLDELDAEDPAYSLSADSSNYAWHTSYVAYGLYSAYMTTKNTDFVDLYAKICHNMFSTLADLDGDGYLGWGTGTYNEGQYDEFAVHTGTCISSFANFALLIQGDETLAARPNPQDGAETLGTLAQRLVDVCVTDLVPAYEVDFHPGFGVYMSRAGSGNYGGAAGYTNPHNQYLALASGLYSLALVAPDHAASLAARADVMAQVFKGWLRVNKEGFVVWNYDDPFYAKDHDHLILEDYSHAMHDYLAAIDAYHRGAVFSYEDISKFAENLAENMFNGDFEDVKVTEFVTGGKRGHTGLPYIYNILLSRYGNREKVWHISEGGYAGRLYDAAMIFSMHPDAPAPEGFSLSLPAHKAAEVDPNAAIFHWTASKNAADYTLVIAETADFSSIAVERPFIAATGAFVDALLGGRTYYWKVIARSENGEMESPVFSFTTKTEAKLAPKVLSFAYKLGEDVPLAGRSLRVYLHRELLAEIPFDESGQWESFSLDLTKKLGFSSTAGIKIALYSDHADPASETLYIDDVSLSGGEQQYTFTDETEEYTVWGRPSIYARRNKSQEENGVLALRLPVYDEVKFYANYAGTGKIVNEVFADFGFTFPHE